MNFQMNKILVAKDLSKGSSRVIRYALELGCKFHAQVHVLHVMPTVDSSVLNRVALTMGADTLAKFNALNEADLAEKTRVQLDEIIKTETELMAEDHVNPPQIEVHHGDPTSMILAVADRLDVDMIILGSHSKGKLHYAFLGSVAEKVLRKTNRTVTIVPPR
ncbi:Nucleotide-binding universal stress protein, UspA family [Desulfuromusa kysingii]|uniref:Nucleotide-binding universal stress protein, UspA family n=1 Tax=Desulfuromusa kysingii TaxID=37625 RepID=A0A1H3X1N5_9BACT|nr:universal stress protein [Desulfuromusa kysingii]SDZ92554.1 Nucleotide-binding universal stress protein, UspA family [Desulfuromusa kysingii]